MKKKSKLEDYADIVENLRNMLALAGMVEYALTGGFKFSMAPGVTDTLDEAMYARKKELYQLYQELNDSEKLIVAVEYGIPENPDGGDNG